MSSCALPQDPSRDQVIELICNIDDMSGEALGFAMERLLSAGALDVWFTPIYMKKNRPGVMLSVLCRPDEADRLRQELLTYTSTLGVRWRKLERLKALREVVSVSTPWGTLRCKVKYLGGKVASCKAEHDDCAAAARSADIPLDQVTNYVEREAKRHLER